MKRSFCLSALVLSAFVLKPVLAQPDAETPPKTENPPNWQQRPNFRDMTPAQREAAMKKMRVDGLRRMMTVAEINDAPTQDALMAFLDSEDKAREPLTKAGYGVIQTVGAVAMGKPAATDEEISGALATYREAVKVNEERRNDALENLDAQINWRKSPRIDAFLTLMGYTDTPGIMSGGMGGMMGGGMPGMMGGMGGNGRGRGGGNRPRPNNNPPADAPADAPAPAPEAPADVED